MYIGEFVFLLNGTPECHSALGELKKPSGQQILWKIFFFSANISISLLRNNQYFGLFELYIAEFVFLLNRTPECHSALG